MATHLRRLADRDAAQHLWALLTSWRPEQPAACRCHWRVVAELNRQLAALTRTPRAPRPVGIGITIKGRAA